MTAHLPHDVVIAKIGFIFKMTVGYCACGIDTSKGGDMYALHWQREQEMRQWHASLKRNKPNNNFFR